MNINEWHWKPEPDYTRLLDAIYRRGAKPCPFIELFADDEIIYHFWD